MRLAFLSVFIGLASSCGGPTSSVDGGSTGGGSAATGGGTAATGGGTAATGGGTAATGGGTAATGGGTAATGGGTTSTGGGTAATGGGTAATGGGTTSTGGGTAATGGGTAATGGGTAATGGGTAATGIPYVFVIAMENKNESSIYGNKNAPYINNTLMVNYGYAKNYGDCVFVTVPSEPHYVWLEASTNAFGDWTSKNDDDPSQSNSTNDTSHLATQLTAAGKTWRSYQEGLDSNTGACPIHTSGFYAAKHDPFVFFQDIAGNPPAADNANCAAHHKPYSALAADLAAKDVAAYTFITPNLCNDMHGAGSCKNGCLTGLEAACVSAGDTWLKDAMVPILDFINANGGVLFVVWDEPELISTQPFLVVGPHVKKGYGSTVAVTHSSYVKTLDEIFKLPVLSKAASANDFSDYFVDGGFP